MVQISHFWNPETAPEILNESPNVDLTLADVYSFGTHFWLYDQCLFIYYSVPIFYFVMAQQRNNPMGTANKRTTLPWNEVNSINLA